MKSDEKNIIDKFSCKNELSRYIFKKEMEDDLFDFVERTISSNKSPGTEEVKNFEKASKEENNDERMFKDISEKDVQEMATKISLMKEEMLKHIKELEEENIRFKGEVNKSIATTCPSCHHINGEYPKSEKEVEGFIYVDGKTLRLKFNDANEMKKFYYDNKLHLFDK